MAVAKLKAVFCGAVLLAVASAPTPDAMRDGATTVGDGNPWTPTLTVKGGASGFYLIRVDK